MSDKLGEFKPIQNFSGYLIFNDGRVFSYKVGKFLKGSDNGNGYKTVMLHFKGKYFQKYRHRLVAEHFINNPNNLKQVDHIDRDKNNNNVSNLRWISAKDNIKNLANKERYSIKRNYTTYTQVEVNLIVTMYSQGFKVSYISKLRNIPRQTISSILKRNNLQ